MDRLTVEDKRNGFTQRQETDYRVLFLDEHTDVIGDGEDFDSKAKALARFESAKHELAEHGAVGLVLEKRVWQIQSCGGHDTDGDFTDEIIAEYGDCE